MLSDAAKAEIIGALAGCFVLSLALLLCLLCPCPLRAAVSTCIERSRSGYKKPTHGFGGKAEMAFCGCSCDCCPDVQALKPTPVGVVEVDTMPPSISRHAWLDRQPLEADPTPPVTLTFSVTRLQDCLAVHLHNAEGTPGPRLGLCHCNFALVRTEAADSVPVATADVGDNDEANSVRTGVVSQTASPVFNETLVLPLEAADAEDLRLLVRCLDYDRFSRERVVGEVRVPLPREIDEPVLYKCMPMGLPQAECGALLLALNYMPTAEQLVVFLLKASDVYAADGSVPSTYLHLVLLSGGSVVQQRRSHVFEGTPRPVYNESVSIDLPMRRLDRVSLIVSVMNCRLGRSVRPDLDTCLGYVLFSAGCYGSGRAHWMEMAGRPGTPVAYWHRLA